jgi:hypothetical protein
MNYTRAALCPVLFLGGLIGSAQTTVIRIAPPPPVRVGVVGVAPGPGYVWIGGYQRWTGSGYVWVAGRWVRPPRAGVVWVQPGMFTPEAPGCFTKGTGASTLFRKRSSVVLLSRSLRAAVAMFLENSDQSAKDHSQ